MASLHSLLKCVISVTLTLGEDVKNNKMRQNNRWTLKRGACLGETAALVSWEWRESGRDFLFFFVIWNISDGRCGDACCFSSLAVPHPTLSFTPPLLLSGKTKAGDWKRSEVGKCIQWHRPDDSILPQPCNICFQPCLRAGMPCCAFCPTCSSHRAAVNGSLVHVYWSRNFSY